MTQYLQEYARFATISDMHTAANKHSSLHQNRLTKSDRQVLETIRNVSDIYGAAHLTHEAIARDTGKSHATVRRAILKLESLGIIQKIHYIHPVIGGLGGNIYIILPFNERQ